jgi:hypothetical protein
VRRGMRAQELLNNQLFNESVAQLENDLLAQIRTVSLNDVSSHTRLTIAVQVVGAVTRHLRNIVQDGEIASGSIDLRGKRID